MSTGQASMQRTMLSIQATPDIAGIRTAEFRGQEHTVIPAVALVEGVLWPVNAAAPELALAEEFGRFPDSWNGRPVVYGHPLNAEGVPISAGAPDVLETNAFGQLFNTVLEGGKLKTEIWINNALIADLSEEGQETIESLKNGEGIVEVSTGMFIMSERVNGEFDGEEYESIWRNIVPDHLAVLAKGKTGACSIKDGCGAPRTNEMKPVMRAAQLNANCDCQTGVITDNEDEEHEGIFKRLLELAGGLLQFRGQEDPTTNSAHLSDSDLRSALTAGLAAAEPDEFTWILAIFANNSDAGQVIFEKGWNGELFSRDFKVSKAGAVTLKGDSTRVRPVTQFLPVDVITDNESHSTIEEIAMNKEELVNGLISNETTQYVEDDRGWLSSLEESVLTRMSPVVAEEATPTPEEIAASEQAVIDAAAESNDAPVTTEAYIASAPPEIQDVLNQGVRMHEARKKALVTGLVANERCKFSQTDLESKPLAELENLAILAFDVTYEGSAPLITAAEDSDAIPEAPKLFDLNANAA